MNFLLLLISFLCFFTTNLAYASSVKLRDKIGQMLIIGFEGSDVDIHSPIVKAIQMDNIGGVVLFDFNPKTAHFDKNIINISQVRKLTHDLQQVNHDAQLNHHRELLPLIISVDYEGGDRATRLSPSHGFPQTLSAKMVGHLGDDVANKNANIMASNLHDAGLNLNFSPVLDVNVNPNNPIIGALGRSFSANPNEVTHYAEIYSKHFLNHHVQCAYKHFPGHGSSTADSHLGFVDVSQTWQPKELQPYSQLLKRKTSCGMVMTAHLVNRQLDKSGLPATLSYKIITQILRKKMKFQGVVITDDMQMKAITNSYSLEESVTLAINAGADMLLFGNQLTDAPQDIDALIRLIEQKVRSKEISEQRINDAYEHIVRFKNTLQ